MLLNAALPNTQTKRNLGRLLRNGWGLRGSQGTVLNAEMAWLHEDLLARKKHCTDLKEFRPNRDDS